MAGKRIALVTCLNLPEPDADRELTLAALAERGADPCWVAWDDPQVRWAEFDLVVLRSTWNYVEHAEAFLAWIEAVAAQTRLLNPAPVVAWNAHKRYLIELADRGHAVAPTLLFARGAPVDLAARVGERGWSRIVVKPAISAGSFCTRRFDARQPAELAAGADFLKAALAERDMLVQPYVPAVETTGERSLIWIDGAFTHAIRKTPRFSGEDERVSDALPIAADERLRAAAILADLPGIPQDALTYARVDMARDAEGVPMLMELELIEPSLFLLQSPAATARFAAALLARARQTPK